MICHGGTAVAAYCPLRRFSIGCAVPIRASVAPVSDVPKGIQEKPWKLANARLVLEDGSVWRAKSFGASGTQVGEVVFNTPLTGYQEILTDPSYAGQFVLMTNPHIGNTGINFDDEESSQCFLAGLVIRSLSISTSNWRTTEALGDYLASRNVMGIYDVDTRAITSRLREDGSLIGVLSTEESRTDDELLQMCKSWDIVGVDLISGFPVRHHMNGLIVLVLTGILTPFGEIKKLFELLPMILASSTIFSVAWHPMVVKLPWFLRHA